MPSGAAAPPIGGICSFNGCVGGTEGGVSGVIAPARLTIGVVVVVAFFAGNAVTTAPFLGRPET